MTPVPDSTPTHLESTTDLCLHTHLDSTCETSPRGDVISYRPSLTMSLTVLSIRRYIIREHEWREFRLRPYLKLLRTSDNLEPPESRYPPGPPESRCNHGNDVNFRLSISQLGYTSDYACINCGQASDTSLPARESRAS